MAREPAEARPRELGDTGASGGAKLACELTKAPTHKVIEETAREPADEPLHVLLQRVMCAPAAVGALTCMLGTIVVLSAMLVCTLNRTSTPEWAPDALAVVHQDGPRRWPVVGSCAAFGAAWCGHTFALAAQRWAHSLLKHLYELYRQRRWNLQHAGNWVRGADFVICIILTLFSAGVGAAAATETTDVSAGVQAAAKGKTVQTSSMHSLYWRAQPERDLPDGGGDVQDFRRAWSSVHRHFREQPGVRRRSVDILASSPTR